jgi:hypothetical protein
MATDMAHEIVMEAKNQMRDEREKRSCTLYFEGDLLTAESPMIICQRSFIKFSYANREQTRVDVGEENHSLITIYIPRHFMSLPQKQAITELAIRRLITDMQDTQIVKFGVENSRYSYSFTKEHSASRPLLIHDTIYSFMDLLIFV